MGSHAPQECVGRRTHNLRYFSTYIWERYRTVSERYQNGIRTVQWNGTERYIRMEPFYHPFHHPNYDELPVISLLENNHLLKPNSIEPTIRQVCLLGRAPAGRSSNIIL